MQKIKENIYSILLLLVLISIWHLCSQSNELAFIIGNPKETFLNLYTNTINFKYPYNSLVTGAEAFLGFILGTTCGICAGFLCWYSPSIAKLVRPYIFVLSVVPIFAFSPIVIIWFGIGFTMKVFLAAFGSYIVALTNTFEGASSIDKKQIQIYKLCGATRLQILTKFIFPSSLYFIFQSMRSNIGIALLGAFIGEFLSSNTGIASIMVQSGSLYDVSGVLAASIYLILIALVLQFLVMKIESQKDKIISFISVSKKIRI